MNTKLYPSAPAFSLTSTASMHTKIPAQSAQVTRCHLSCTYMGHKPPGSSRRSWVPAHKWCWPPGQAALPPGSVWGPGATPGRRAGAAPAACRCTRTPCSPRAGWQSRSRWGCCGCSEAVREQNTSKSVREQGYGDKIRNYVQKWLCKPGEASNDCCVTQGILMPYWTRQGRTLNTERKCEDQKWLSKDEGVYGSRGGEHENSVPKEAVSWF